MEQRVPNPFATWDDYWEAARQRAADPEKQRLWEIEEIRFELMGPIEKAIEVVEMFCSADDTATPVEVPFNQVHDKLNECVRILLTQIEQRGWDSADQEAR